MQPADNWIKRPLKEQGGPLNMQEKMQDKCILYLQGTAQKR